MNDREKFGQYLAMKRKQLNLTQEQLAETLYVTATTVSKWERGITYPDIGLIPSLCKQLSISEHEFFTACDDLITTEKEKEAHKYRRLVKIVQWGFLISYLITLVTCFICNIALDHTLSWFYIVLVSILMGFTVTNLPYFLKQFQVSNRSLWICGIMTVLIYILVSVCAINTKGEWLFTGAYPIITFEVGLCWIGIIAIRFWKTNWYCKGSVISFLLAIVTLFTNPLCQYVLKEEGTNDMFINGFIGAGLITTSIVLFIIGIIRYWQTKKR